MAVGFTPRYFEDFPFYDLTQEEFLVLAIETAKKMELKIGYVSYLGLIAFAGNDAASRHSEIRITLDQNIANIRSTSTGSEMVDWGRNKKNVANFIAVFNEVKAIFTREELAAMYEGLQPYLVPLQHDILRLPPPSATDNIKDIFSIFTPSKGYFITPILVLINVIVFIVMGANGVDVIQPGGESLLKWGANFRPLTLNGEWWRLVTCCFLHIGLLHLLLNMYALIYIGLLLEPHLGKARFLSAYIVTGIAASVASLWWHDITISAGASGAIFGMYGVFLAMLTTNFIDKTDRKPLLISIAIFVTYNLLNGLKGGIDNAAHIGGLISGFVMGYAFVPSLKKPESKILKFGTIAVISILILGYSWAMCKSIT